MGGEPDIDLNPAGAYLLWSPTYFTIVIIFSSIPLIICGRPPRHRYPNYALLPRLIPSEYLVGPRHHVQEPPKEGYAARNDPNYRTMNITLEELPDDNRPDTFKPPAPRRDPVDRYNKDYQTRYNISDIKTDLEDGKKVTDGQNKPGTTEGQPSRKGMKMADPNDSEYLTMMGVEDLSMDADAKDGQGAALAKKPVAKKPRNLAITEPNYYTSAGDEIEEKSKPGRKETKF